MSVGGKKKKEARLGLLFAGWAVASRAGALLGWPNWAGSAGFLFFLNKTCLFLFLKQNKDNF